MAFLLGVGRFTVGAAAITPSGALLRFFLWAFPRRSLAVAGPDFRLPVKTVRPLRSIHRKDLPGAGALPIRSHRSYLLAHIGYGQANLRP